ncbi:MAG: type II toxin-antitoxin system HicB family antitoxin [Desulforhabdus sp.]|jgi:predicted HicB family RNase H-like nuclease|nr:type II toxin-antitoxin system HicB family antitoxin [Desulforhabdus sp.]
MRNVIEIDGVKAVITYDPEISMFRGEFVGLNGGADFFATDVEGLKREGRTTLKVFLDMCREDGVEPFKRFSGKFMVRISPELHAEIVAAARSSGMSLNQWIEKTLEQWECAHN